MDGNQSNSLVTLLCSSNTGKYPSQPLDNIHIFLSVAGLAQ
jgi:hypothetical protein